MSLLGDSLRGWWTFADGATLAPTFGGDTLENNGSVTFGSGIATFAGGGPLDLPFAAASAAGVVTGDFDWTWAIRFRVSALPVTTPQILFGQGDIGSSDLGVVVTLRTDGRVFFQITPDGVTTSGNVLQHTATVSTDTWTTVIMRYNDATGTIWGTVQTDHQSQAEATVHESGGDIQIGDQVGLSSDPFTGDMAWVGFWDLFLTNDECLAVHNSGNGREPDGSGVFALTNEVVTVGSGGSYATLAAWKTAERKNLVANNASHELQFLETLAETVTLGDWGDCDEDRGITFTCPAAPHDGTYASSGVGGISGGASACITLDDAGNHLTIEGLTFTTSAVAVTEISGATVTVKRCISDGAARLVQVATGTGRIENSIAQGGAACLRVANSGGTLTAYGCTLTCTSGNVFDVVSGGTVTEDGNYCHSASGTVYAGAGTINKGAATATSNTEAVTAALDSIAHDTDTFVNVTNGSEDYHLATESPLLGVGPDFAALGITDDLVGTQRPQGDEADIGALETPITAAGSRDLLLLGVG